MHIISWISVGVACRQCMTYVCMTLYIWKGAFHTKYPHFRYVIYKLVKKVKNRLLNLYWWVTWSWRQTIVDIIYVTLSIWAIIFKVWTLYFSLFLEMAKWQFSWVFMLYNIYFEYLNFRYKHVSTYIFRIYYMGWKIQKLRLLSVVIASCY